MNKTLLILILVLFLSGLGAVGFYIYQQESNSNEDIPTENVIDEETKTIEQEIVVEEEEEITEEEEIEPLEFDYEDLALLSDIMICYLAKNPHELVNFPDGSLRAFFDFYSKRPEIAEMDCQQYQYDEVDTYMNSLLNTDEDNDGLNRYLENIYFIDDNKEDTDGDTYDDLTEILNGYNPNDEYTGEQGLDLFEYNEEELVDTNEEVVEDEEVVVDEEEEEEEEDEVAGPPVEEGIDVPEDCLDLPSNEIDQCLHQFSIEYGSLAPCELSQDFNACLALDWGIFIALQSQTECYTYESEMNIANFDQCLSLRAIEENNVYTCFDLKDMVPINCINQTIVQNSDASHCGNVYYWRDPVNSDDNFQYQKECINQLYSTEPTVEEQAVLGCQNMVEREDKNLFLFKIACYTSLAVEYEKEAYCDTAANVTGQYNSSVKEDCLEKMGF